MDRDTSGQGHKWTGTQVDRDIDGARTGTQTDRDKDTDGQKEEEGHSWTERGTGT